MAMGAANVIPGVSGGTIALICGIFQRLIDALRSFDGQALQLVRTRRWHDLAAKVDLRFLIALGLGIAVSLLSLARLLSWALERHPVDTWAYFFGLILGSVWFVGTTVGRWRAAPILAFLVGLVIAAGIAVLPPAAPNPHPLYLMVCGATALVSMILPGLSGSYVLLLLGNYKLVLDAVNDLQLMTLVWFGAGMAAGLVTFARLISWLFRRHRDATIAVLTGFILGSLLIIWPWKTTGADLAMVADYTWRLPDLGTAATWRQFGLIMVGGITVAWLERSGKARAEAGPRPEAT